MTIKCKILVFFLSPGFPGRHDLLKFEPEFRLHNDRLFSKIDVSRLKYRHIVPIGGLASVVYLSDDMVRLYRLRPPYQVLVDRGRYRPGLKAFRCDDLYEGFIEPTLRAFERLHLKLFMYAIVCDNPYNVGPAKNRHRPSETKLGRQVFSPLPSSPIDDGLRASSPLAWGQSASVDNDDGREEESSGIYPDDADFCDGGIRYTCFETDSIRTEPVNMYRLMSSRHLRSRFYEYLLGKMRKDKRLRPMRILYVFDRHGPFAIASGKAVQHPELASTTAEADIEVAKLALPFEHPLLSSVDRDVEVIALLNAHRFRGTLHVKQSETECIDAKAMAEHLRAAGSSPEAFCIGVMLCGTDYCDQSRKEDGPFPRISQAAIIESVHNLIHVFKVPILKSERRFNKLVAHVHTTQRSKKMPAADVCRQGFLNARMNFKYWVTMDYQYPMSEQARFILYGDKSRGVLKK